MRILPAPRKLQHLLIAASLLLGVAAAVSAHPGSGIALDDKGQIYFVDTGQGVWKLGPDGRLELISKVSYHWMALDDRGHFAGSQVLGDFDRGSFERITPPGSVPALIISSDYPITVGPGGGLYYVPYNKAGPRRLVRRMPDGRRSVVATLPADIGAKPMQWVNGIAATGDGSIYYSDNDAILKVDKSGAVSTFRDAIQLNDCANPLPETPKLPYLRGIAVSPNGTVYAAANGCRSLIAVPAGGPIRTVLKAEGDWSPTAVALSGNDVFVLECLHRPGGDRETWIPRVRKISAGGEITTLTTIKR